MILLTHVRMRLQASLAAVCGTFFWWHNGGSAFAILAVVLAAFAVCAWLSPHTYLPIQRALDFLVHVVVTALSWSLLALVYFGIFAPSRIVLALSGRDPLRRKSKGALTNLSPLPPSINGHFKRQY